MPAAVSLLHCTFSSHPRDWNLKLSSIALKGCIYSSALHYRNAMQCSISNATYAIQYALQYACCNAIYAIQCNITQEVQCWLQTFRFRPIAPLNLIDSNNYSWDERRKDSFKNQQGWDYVGTSGAFGDCLPSSFWCKERKKEGQITNNWSRHR